MAALLLSLSLPAVAGADQPLIDAGTRRVESRLTAIAVPPFAVPGDDPFHMGITAARVVSFDLKFSGHFAPNENFGHLLTADNKDRARGAIDFNQWHTLTKTFLVKGAFEPTPDGRLTMRVYVYNVLNHKITYSRRYTGAAGQFREMAHMFADDFLKQIFAEEGVSRSRIAFTSRHEGRKELFLADYDGNEARRVTSDGSLVLFPHLNQVYDQVLFTTYRYRNPDLYRLDLATGARFPISRKLGLNTTGEFSPDGKKIVFSLSYRGNSEIYTAGIDGSGLRRLTRSIAIETAPSWSPDGRHIAYTSDRTGAPQIYVMNADGSDPKRLTYEGSYNDAASWSPRGDWIAYASLIAKDFNIAAIDARSIDVERRRDVMRLTADSRNNESPAFAPNGRHITFMSNRSGEKQVYIMNVDGGNQTRITFLPGGGYSPSWGPGAYLLKR